MSESATNGTTFELNFDRGQDALSNFAVSFSGPAGSLISHIVSRVVFVAIADHPPVSHWLVPPQLSIYPASIGIVSAPNTWALSLAVMIIQEVKRHWPAIASPLPLPAAIDAHVHLWGGAKAATVPAKAAVIAAERALAKAKSGLHLAEVHLSAVTAAMPDMNELLRSRMPS